MKYRKISCSVELNIVKSSFILTTKDTIKLFRVDKFSECIIIFVCKQGALIILLSQIKTVLHSFSLKPEKLHTIECAPNTSVICKCSDVAAC